MEKLTKVQKQGYETTQMQFTAPFFCIFYPKTRKKPCKMQGLWS